MSPSLFNLYINSLVTIMKRLGLGVEVQCLMVVVLLYADDVAILAESEQDLQIMLNILHEWTREFDMFVNIDTTKFLHFRRGTSIPCSQWVNRSYR